MRWNTTHGAAKGFRFHPATLRIAVYLHGMAGTAAYNLLREVMHLPSPSRVKQLQAQTAPPATGVLRENIKVWPVLSRGHGGLFDTVLFVMFQIELLG